MHLKCATTAPPSLTLTPTISSLATTPTILSYGPPPPPPQPPPAPNILPSFRVSDTSFASIIALQPKGRGGSFKSGLNFAVAGAGAEMNEMRKDIFTQITQSPPPPPAPNILENSALFLFPFFTHRWQRSPSPISRLTGGKHPKATATNKHLQLRHHLETGVWNTTSLNQSR